MLGQTTCRMHGAAAPRARARGQQRIIVAKVRERLHEEGVSDEPVDVLAELQRLVREVVNLKDRLAGYLSKQERIDPNELAVLERALDRCGRLLVAVAGLDLDSRIQKINSEQVDRVLLAMRSFASDVGQDVDDPEVGRKMARALRSVSSPT
jgi:hypothetical protein